MFFLFFSKCSNCCFFVFTIKSNGTSFSIHQKLLWILSTTIIQDYQFKYILHCLCMFYPESFLFSAPKALTRSFYLFNCFLNMRTFSAPHLEETLELLTLPKTVALIAKFHRCSHSFSSTLIWVTAAVKGIDEIYFRRNRMDRDFWRFDGSPVDMKFCNIRVMSVKYLNC